MSSPLVVIVGRPNVGKSSLFNRIVGRRAAVVADREGVTRDRHYQMAEWNGRSFQLVDTGGFLAADPDPLSVKVQSQIRAATAEAQVVIFMTDGKAGVSEPDLHFARLIQKTGKPVLLAVNKSEKQETQWDIGSAWSLGLGEPMPISALHGIGVADLLDRVVNSLPDHWEEDGDETPPLRVAILGRPNAGKSTLVNSILGEERVVVSEWAGTTRDAIDTSCLIEGRTWILTDTAGLRKKARVKDEVEYFSNQRALEAIRRSDVCVLLIDSLRGMEIQDFRICEQVFKAGRGLVIGLNKWDAVEKADKTFDHMVKALVEKAPDLEGVPFISLSGLTGQRIHRLLRTIEEVYDSLTRILGREAVTRFLEDAWAKHPHPTTSVGPAHLTRACQVHVLPPAIAFEVKNPERVQPSYVRYLKRQALEAFGLKGVPLGIWFRSRFRLRTDEDLRAYLRRGGRLDAAEWNSDAWESEEESLEAEEFAPYDDEETDPEELSADSADTADGEGGEEGEEGDETEEPNPR